MNTNNTAYLKTNTDETKEVNDMKNYSNNNCVTTGENCINNKEELSMVKDTVINTVTEVSEKSIMGGRNMENKKVYMPDAEMVTNVSEESIIGGKTMENTITNNNSGYSTKKTLAAIAAVSAVALGGIGAVSGSNNSDEIKRSMVLADMNTKVEILEETEEIQEDQSGEEEENVDEISELENQLAEAEAEYDQAESSYEEAVNALEDAKSTAENELNGLQEELNEAQQELENAQADLQNAEEAQSAAEQELESESRHIEELEEQIVNIEEEKTQTEQNINDSTAAIEAIGTQMEAAQEDLNNAISGYDEALENYNKAIAEYDFQDEEEALANLQNAEEALKNAQLEVDSKAKDLISAKEIYLSDKQERDQADSEYNEILNRLNEINRVLDKTSSTKSEAQRKLKDAEKILGYLKTDLNNVIANPDDCVIANPDYNRLANEANQQINTAQQKVDEITGTLSDLQSRISNAQAQYDKGSLGFFENHDPDTRAEQVINNMIASQDNNIGPDGKYIADNEKTYLGAEDDATSLENMKETFAFLRESNEYRMKHGAQALSVSDYMMAIAQIKTNASAGREDHTHWYGTGENLMFNPVQEDPFEYWYEIEKSVYDYKKAHPQANDQQVADALGIGRHLVQTGHYKNLIYSEYEVTGFGINTEYDDHYYGNCWGQEFSYDGPIQGKTYSVEQYQADFNSYYDQVTGELEAAKAARSSAWNELSAAQSEVDKAKAYLSSIPKTISNYDLVVTNAKADVAAAEKKAGELRKAYEDAEVSYSNTLTEKRALEELQKQSLASFQEKQNTLNESTRKYNTLNYDYSTAKQNVTDAEDNYIDAQENYNKVMANNQESRGIIDALKDTLNAMTDRRNSAQDLVDNYASSKQQKQEDLDKANNEYTEILNRKEDIQKEIENALNRKEELNSRINEANDARTVSESTYNRVNETVNNLKKNIEINLSIDFNDLKDVADKAKEAVDSAFAKINTIREKLNALLSLNEAEQMIDNAAGENITDQTVTDEQVSNENTSVADETDKQNTVIIHISEELPASDVSHDDAISEAINNDENVEIVFTSTSSENKQQNQEKENKHDAANESKNNKDKRLPVIEKTVEDDKQQNDKVNNKKQQADGLNPWVITAGFSTAAGLLFAIIRIMEMKKAIR